jgi:hypothetical protein
MHKSPRGLSKNDISFPRMKYSLSVFLPKYLAGIITYPSHITKQNQWILQPAKPLALSLGLYLTRN